MKATNGAGSMVMWPAGATGRRKIPVVRKFHHTPRGITDSASFLA